MITGPAEFQGERIVLEQLRVGAQFVASTAVLEREPVAPYDELALRLKAFVLADRLVTDSYTAHAEYEVPASWWQAWKQSNLDYLLRWFPVRTDKHKVPVEVKFTRYATYPDARIAPPKFGRPYIYEMVEQTR